MCTRYWLDPAEMPENWRGVLGDASGKFDIRPADKALVLLPRGEMLMEWGFTLRDKRIVNARVESAGEKPLFAQHAGRHRCLVPACGFYEWRKVGKAREKYLFTRPEGTLYMAGLYREEEDGFHFVVLTTDAPGDAARIHDRVPLIVENTKAWLDGSLTLDEAQKAALKAFSIRPEKDEEQLSFF